MPSYRSIEDAIRRLNTTAETLREFQSCGWISAVEKNGYLYIAGHQEYRARFILDLQRRLRLNTRQISKVLAAQEPPYSFKDAERISAGLKEESGRSHGAHADGERCVGSR